MSPSYPFAGLPLTPGVFSNLALEVVEPGSIVERSKLAELVSREHESRGGLPSRAAPVAVAKKALRELQISEKVERAGVPGFWRFGLHGRLEDAERTVEIGTGTQAVYVYYFPAYRELAMRRGETSWPMKIGRTNGPSQVRINEQCGTAMPERPIMGLVYRTDQASTGERLLHSTLTTRGRKMDDAPGKEWFLTNLDEVREILDFALG